MLERVAAEDGEDRGLTARGQRLGAVHNAADCAACGKGINGGDVGVLERRFAAEGLDGVVRHAVADDNKIFHRSASLSDDECSIAGEWAKIKDKSPRTPSVLCGLMTLTVCLPRCSAPAAAITGGSGASAAALAVAPSAPVPAQEKECENEQEKDDENDPDDGTGEEVRHVAPGDQQPRG